MFVTKDLTYVCLIFIFVLFLFSILQNVDAGEDDFCMDYLSNLLKVPEHKSFAQVCQNHLDQIKTLQDQLATAKEKVNEFSEAAKESAELNRDLESRLLVAKKKISDGEEHRKLLHNRIIVSVLYFFFFLLRKCLILCSNVKLHKG